MPARQFLRIGHAMSLDSRTRKIGILGSTAAVTLAIGAAGVVIAPGASAATSKPVVISAPKSVTSGSEFTLKCNIKPKSIGKGWKGATAVVHENGVPVRASRVIGKNGACSMKLILSAKGSHKVRVVAIGAQNVIKSGWINVKVK